MKKVLLMGLCGVMALPVFAQEEPELTPQEKTALIAQIRQEHNSSTSELDVGGYFQVIEVDASPTELPWVDISVVELLTLPQSDFVETVIELIQVPHQLATLIDQMTPPQLAQFEMSILALPDVELESIINNVLGLPRSEIAALLVNFPEDLRNLIIQKTESPDLKNILVLLTGVQARALVQNKELNELSQLLINNDVDSNVVASFINRLQG